MWELLIYSPQLLKQIKSSQFQSNKVIIVVCLLKVANKLKAFKKNKIQFMFFKRNQ